MLTKLKNKLTNYQIIAIVILILILLGAFLLCLPIASTARTWTPYINSLFTATSALCVTGLIIYDTFMYWSLFGQLVILFLIQVGGIGFMTIMAILAKAIGKRLSLHQKVMFVESTGGSIARSSKLLVQVIAGTFIIEGIGALILCTRFIPVFGWGRGIYFSIFHAISAFCNAGFDLMGATGTVFPSLTPFATDIVVNLVIMSLIVLGGLGFLVWSDFVEKKGNFKKLSFHTKIVLTSTAILLVTSIGFFYLFERNNTLAGYTGGQKVLISMMSAISPRTAGFNTVNLANLTESGRTLTVVLMLIGGGPGSTAGGLKVTTIAVLILAVRAQIQRKDSISVFKRRMDDRIYLQAAATVGIYLSVVIISAITICAIQPFSMTDVIFEVVSAAGTVGLTLGITPSLNIASKLIIIGLMFGGKVGMLSLMMIFDTKKKPVPLDRPIEQIIIG